jgi:hypothetical protein
MLMSFSARDAVLHTEGLSKAQAAAAAFTALADRVRASKDAPLELQEEGGALGTVREQGMKYAGDVVKHKAAYVLVAVTKPAEGKAPAETVPWTFAV